jgi:carboxymethylenebutenolidase
MRYEAMFAETVYMRGHQGEAIEVYFARPLGAGPYPGVVIIPMR